MESHEVLQLVLTQVWQVALIGAVVWILTRTFAKNQPHLAHLLWALVLLKVIAPPLWSSGQAIPYKAEDQNAGEAVYIDHNHFHMRSNPETAKEF